ncbi:DUF4192 family protein [Microbacterium sp. ASV81]|uniref:DUF4192 family protein n=1 Tax=Microbacterium capsulatum TaxID=3041921 RepID=A0ABU0XJ60_9MICO|nr:DUF4192 family protein [Microbacterium sp. ASV81]MDQ4215168.1 DUF4192 family protein [Microbacterium sp. ASV81]
MTTIVHAAGAAELLAAIPVLTGFTPRNSLVLLPFRASRTAGALRFDLPGPPGDDAPTPSVEEFAATAIGLACRVPDTDALAIAVYADGVGAGTGSEPPADHLPPDPLLPADHLPAAALPAAELVAELVRRADACGLRIVEALHIGADAWTDYLDPSAPPHPIADVPAAPEVPGFAGPAPDQISGAELPAPGLFAAEKVGRALLAVERVLGPAALSRAVPSSAGPVDPQAHGIALALDDLPAFLDEVLDAPEAQSPFATAALVWILNRPALRDVALVQWARSIDEGDAALAAQLSFGAAGTAVPESIGETMIGRGPRPDADRLGVALTLVRRTIALAPRAVRGGPLAAAAWLAWATGRSTHAAHYLDLLDEVDAELSFGHLLRAIVDAGMLPDWAFGKARAA